uniref:SEA domain-containing protein n=1 Tax=Tetranychus urticae TaxID=32264 RepID=T1KED7_TETUR
MMLQMGLDITNYLIIRDRVNCPVVIQWPGFDNRSDIDYDSDSNDEPVKKQINTGLGLLPRRHVICTDKLIEEIDSCQYGTIYCPETDECLVNCPSTSPESIPTTDGTINFFDLNGTDVIDNIPADNLPEDEFYANSTDLVVTIPIVLTFKDDYETAVVNRSRLFIQSIKRQLVKNLNLPESSIQNLVILKNPFKISFDLVYWPEQDDFSNITLSSFRETVSKFQEKLLTTGIDFTGLDNETIVAIKDDNKKVPDVQQPPTTVQGNQKTETSSTSSPEKSNASEFSDGRNNLAIILGLVAGAVLLILIVIIGIIYRKRTIYNRRRKIAPFSRMVSPLIQIN